MDSATACSVLLVGQPILARQLRMGVFAALAQPITTRYQINPMELGESADYLRHHLALVGRTDALFADDAIAHLHKGEPGPAAGVQQRRYRCPHSSNHRWQSTGR